MANLKYGDKAGLSFSSPPEKINANARTDIKCVYDKLTFASADVALTADGILFADLPRGARLIELDASMSASFDAGNVTDDFEIRVDGSDGSSIILETITVESSFANARSVLDQELAEVDADGDIITYQLVLGSDTGSDVTADGAGSLVFLLKYAK